MSKSALSLRLILRERSNDAASDHITGPLGLTTLYKPPERPVADLIFVHGLTGGSRSTWSKDNDPKSFWPQEWLPKDAGFRDVRIHNFGYNSNWEKESPLNIYDYAKSLLGDIHYRSVIPRDSTVPIIFVGHSIGGLVVKSAYILSKQDTEFSSIANRVRAIAFLATPHRGTNLAQILRNILSFSPGTRPFVTDLHHMPLALQAINEEFSHVCCDLQLFSFYETLPTKSLKSLVVDKDHATLGYENERTAYLNADHRGVCKYTTKRDLNYQIIRSSLASVIGDLRERVTTLREDSNYTEQEFLDSVLGTSDAAEDDFISVDSSRTTGSCEWLVRKSSYLDWQESANTQLYWISARPASGKTVLSGKVISHLKTSYKDCNFCFFTSGNEAKSNITYFLLTMARQMALMHYNIRRAVLELSLSDEQLKKADYKTIWHMLFVETILKLKLVRPQYWVIDALDECQEGVELVLLLVEIMKALPVRAFITSRNLIGEYKQSVPPSIKVVSEEVSKNDTQSDIELYLERNIYKLPTEDDDDRNNMKEKILEKSDGCFLWASLVLQELEKVYTLAEMLQILEGVPSNMIDLYSRILKNMSKQPHGKALTKAILTWTVCAARPLTIAELHTAVQIHIQDSITSVKSAITVYCSQLIDVDAQSRVRLIHQTARDYLLQDIPSSELEIKKQTGHKELAMRCLEYLNSPEMAGPARQNLRTSNMNTIAERSAFANYACNHFFEHLMQVSSTDKDVQNALYDFLNSHNVFSWIEYVAQHSDLMRLFQTGKVLHNLLQRRLKYLPPLGKEVALLDLWGTDLVKLVTNFGKILLARPSSIHHLIPPFCPLESAPRKLFGSSDGIKVVGLSNTTWSDCMSTIVDPNEQFSALDCSVAYFAIGMTSGTIRIFNYTTCQVIKTLWNKHSLTVRFLTFGIKEGVLISADSKGVRVWDTANWEQLWEFKIPALPMSLSLVEEDQVLLISLRNNYCMAWDLSDGTLKYSYNWTQEIIGQRALSFCQPITAACSIEERLLAVLYRGQDILLWDFDQDYLIGTYTKEGGTSTSSACTLHGGAISVVFGAGSSVTLLAAAYLDGDIVVFDTYEGIVINTTHANALFLASSPDGRTLATGGSSGTIQLYDFETLKLLYCVRSDDYAIKCLKFSRDNSRLLDIRASQCQVWDPTVLLRQDREIFSDKASVSTVSHEIGANTFEDVVLVTSLACHRSGKVFFCGKEDGGVYLCETKSGAEIKKLFSHADRTAIVSLYIDDETDLLSSIDSSSRVIIHKLFRKKDSWDVGKPVFDHRTGVAVDQLLSNNQRILISSAMTDALWEICPNSSDGGRIIQVNEWDDVRSYKWAKHPTESDILILIKDYVAHLYDWSTLQRLTSGEGIWLGAEINSELIIRSITPYLQNGIATAFGEFSNLHCKSKLFLWSAADFTLSSQAATVIPSCYHVANDIEIIIGVDGQRLVFLHSDNWICSTDLRDPGNVIRHFFLPADWLTSSVDLIVEMTPNRDVLFVVWDKIAVIKCGLDNLEDSMTSQNGKRRSSKWGLPR